MDLREVILPVIDLKGGHVVRGVAGQRESYRAVQSIWAKEATANAVGCGLQKNFGCDSVYVADLDAIDGGEPDGESFAHLQALGLAVWLDAGLSDVAAFRRLRSRLDARSVVQSEALSGIASMSWIVGLESLQRKDDLRPLLETVGRQSCVFSLDLSHGKPLTSIDGWREADPLSVASEVLEAGFRRLIVLDLAAVGVQEGPWVLALCRQIRNLSSELQLISGGGVRSLTDVAAFWDAGCDRVLVATALHNGAITASDLAASAPRRNP